MKTAHFDCFAGISGDMCLGALVDAGADISAIGKALRKIPVKNYTITAKKVLRNGISATKVDVAIQKTEGRGQMSDVRRQKTDVRSQISEVRKWKDIKKIISGSEIDDRIKENGLKIFKRLFETEARVHGKTPDTVHLHEMGGIDCIVDIMGTLIGLDMLGIEQVCVSPINLGSGTVTTEHGILPVPAPATIELLKGYPVYGSGIPFELTTPTGAAIIAGIGSKAIPFPCMRVEKIGYGAGGRDIENMPNALRIFLGEDADHASDGIVTVIEANIDDMNPQIYEHVFDRLFAAGALDVFMENIIMKKGRPAIKLSVIADDRDLNKMTEILFSETTTIGLRFQSTYRKILAREITRIKTKYGTVSAKISRLDNEIVNISPEYADLKALAHKSGLPLKQIHEDVRSGIYRLKNKRPRRFRHI